LKPLEIPNCAARARLKARLGVGDQVGVKTLGGVQHNLVIRISGAAAAADRRGRARG
jgi:hypothetical protein